MVSLILFLISMISFAAFGSDIVETISPIWNVLGPIVISFGAKFPIIFTIVFFMGTIRLFMKPLMSAIQTYIDSTPTSSDNEFLEKIKQNFIYKIIVFILDWALSLKLPK